MTFTLEALSEKAEPVQVCFTLRSRDQWSKWMQDGCKVYMDSCMTSNGSCFMVAWTILKNHLWRLAWHKIETMALWTFTNVGLFYFTMCEDPHEYKFIGNSIWLRARSHMTSHYMSLEVCWFNHWTLSFGLSQFHGHGSWLVCEVALSPTLDGSVWEYFRHNMLRSECVHVDIFQFFIYWIRVY